MIRNSSELRNFLFFLNQVHSYSIEDSLVGALACPSTWEELQKIVHKARKSDPFARSIDRLHVYVHVPFCGRLCTFCHCPRMLLRRRSDIDDYIKALTQQMNFLAPVYKGMDAKLISFGGGTPSVLDEKQMTDILDAADKAFPSRNRKILFEINPASWTASKLSVLSSRGLYRLSVGVQTLDEKVLKTVTRSQTRKKVIWCLRAARKAGIPCLNVDFIAGLPGQTAKGLIKDMKVMIDEGANIIHVHPYCSNSLQDLCGSGETIPEFFKRRDTMMKTASEVLLAKGFRRKGLGAYTRDEQGEDHQEEAYSRLEAAVAAFGPSAKGQVPGAIFYHTKKSKSASDLSAVDISTHDFSYTMAHYAVIAIMSGLDEKVFLQRFGIALDRHCGVGLRFLQQCGLLSCSKGVWKFSGKWEVQRVREFVALSRVLYGSDFLLRLRTHFHNKYDPKTDYSRGDSFLKTYANSWLMSLYYQMGI